MLYFDDDDDDEEKMMIIEILDTEASEISQISYVILSKTSVSLSFPTSMPPVYHSRLYSCCIWLPTETVQQLGPSFPCPNKSEAHLYDLGKAASVSFLIDKTGNQQHPPCDLLWEWRNKA